MLNLKTTVPITKERPRSRQVESGASACPSSQRKVAAAAVATAIATAVASLATTTPMEVIPVSTYQRLFALEQDRYNTMHARFSATISSLQTQLNSVSAELVRTQSAFHDLHQKHIKFQASCKQKAQSDEIHPVRVCLETQIERLKEELLAANLTTKRMREELLEEKRRKKAKKNFNVRTTSLINFVVSTDDEETGGTAVTAPANGAKSSANDTPNNDSATTSTIVSKHELKWDTRYQQLKAFRGNFVTVMSPHAVNLDCRQLPNARSWPPGLRHNGAIADSCYRESHTFSVQHV